MEEKEFKRIERPATAEERERHAAIRQAAMQEFPPVAGSGRRESSLGIAARIRQAREARALTWHALAKLAGIPDSNTIRDIEYGADVQLSAVQAVAHALGLRLQLTEEKV